MRLYLGIVNTFQIKKKKTYSRKKLDTLAGAGISVALALARCS
jgi:hypothetical protein